ncbi:vesicle docking protein P115 [Ectocarpus siliculosus]|uniref:Vesicle docking protein P115 n=1 Tax=Ectocarpus siliculosus TaxID=2880 RepID=D7G5A9_ECTSI|nr:vesicle docking protein P115 [Ectocarpus siliculosus]|eukprot:CBJ27263.1 vesicle docking protein P115 [Ectocarpus siliculosus]
MEYLGPGNEGVTPQAAAGILVERLKNAGDMGDRRNALDALLKLSQDHPTDVGHAGMPIFTDILQAGIADRSMTQTIMGIMLNLVKEQGANVSSFLKDVQNVQNLLDLLESTDALTALSAVQVLQALQKSSGESLEACILECPAGLQALVEVLRDPREEVRNEVILLLGQLTTSNLEVKKFVAFQEGFERLFDIMSGEGMLEGGSVIVKDCLHVCNNLLSGSSLTKALFCQSGCLKRFHQLIDVRTSDGEDPAAVAAQNGPGTEVVGAEKGEEGSGEEEKAPSHDGAPPMGAMSGMQNEIACKALDVLMLLLARDGGGDADEREGGGGGDGGGGNDDDDGKRPERQTLVAEVSEGMLSEMLAHVAFSRADAFSHAPVACRERAMRVTGALVDGHPTNQYNMGELLIQDVGLDSVALATLVMEGALGKGGADRNRTEACQWVLGCLFHGNELVCTQVVSHIIAPPPPPLELEDIEAWIPPTPPGKVLLDSLAAAAKTLFEGRGDNNDNGDGEGRRVAATQAADVISRGCMIISMLFTHGGALAKELSLRVPLAAATGAHPTTLLHVLLHWLELATSHPPPSTATDRGAPSSSRSGDGPLGRPTVDGHAAADAGISLERLLCGWMYGCPAAVVEMLDNPANLFVVDVAAGRCSVLVEGGEGGATAVQCVALKGLACLALGLLLEYVEGTGAPRSGGGGGGGGGEWTRSLVMKMIQNRVGMTPFMSSIEATKRAFAEAETAQRRRDRAARERKGSGEAGQEGAGNNGELRLDPGFSSLLARASAEVRQRVISILTHGDASDGGGVAADSLETNGGTTTTTAMTSPGSTEGTGGGGATTRSSAAAGGGGAGLASMVELQEKEIAGLREELSEALSRVPRGGGEGGGVSALEGALRNQVEQLEAAAVEQSEGFKRLQTELSDALAQVEAEKESLQLLTSELQGLAVSTSSLERQLLDRESVCDGLRRQLDAGEDSSAREGELARQLEEAHSRALKAEEALELSQKQSLANATADEAAQEASLEAAAKWEAKVEQLQAALEEARRDAASAAAKKALADDDSSKAAATVSAQLVTATEDLESMRKSSVEREAKLEQIGRALAEKTDEADASKQQVAVLIKAAKEAEGAIEKERQAVEAAAEARRVDEAERNAKEIGALRQQLDNAVRSLAEASSGGDQQIEALQKELSAVQHREEQEAAEWQRRLDDCARQAKEEADRQHVLLTQTKDTINDDWARELRNKEATITRLEADVQASKEAHQAAARENEVQNAQLREDNEGLRGQAEQVEVLMARCARLEEAATSAGAETERRLRGEMEREQGLAREAEGSVSALSLRLEEAAKEASEKAALAAELKSRLEEVQAFLSQSEDDRKAAEDREAAAASEAKGMQQAVREAEERLQDAKAELEDRDAVIAAVEDARSAHEREAERLRDKLSGLGKSLTPLDPHANGAAVSANGDSLNDFSNASDDGRDDQVGNAEVRLGTKERS